MQTIRLRIEGMHCGGCEKIVRHLLERQPGVKGCRVSHQAGEARVAVDAGGASGDRLAETVRGAGYGAAVKG